jgi:succinate dehydrogenase/fumarate reductase flavoprotein subunit
MEDNGLTDALVFGRLAGQHAARSPALDEPSRRIRCLRSYQLSTRR